MDETLSPAVVREEFIGFVELQNTDSTTISKAILSILKSCNLDVANLRGQGYDGAAVMAGKVSGVCTQIQKVQPGASYHHCRSHALNLVIASSCKSVQEIRNLFESIGKLTWFLGGSPKRKVILQNTLAADDHESDLLTTEAGNSPSESDECIRSATSKSVPKLCETRWLARVSTVSSIMAKYKGIYAALEEIASQSSAPDSRTSANSFMKMLESPTFIVSLVVAQSILSITHPLSLALQKSDCDVVMAYEDAALCREAILGYRSDANFADVWRKAETIAGSLGIILCKPRTAGSGRYRSSAGCDTENDDDHAGYFRRNIYFPFIDHCLNELDLHFSIEKEASNLLMGYKLLPCKIHSLQQQDVAKLQDHFGSDLPESTGLPGEIGRWKAKVDKMPDKQVGLLEALQMATVMFFPNIHTIFKQMLTVPVGSVPCERSFSALRRLKDWSRSTMGENRLNGLALMYTHRDWEISMENVLRRFDSAGHRRIGSLTWQ